MRRLLNFKNMYMQTRALNSQRLVKRFFLIGRSSYELAARWQSNFVSSNGYPTETHKEILTQDGYHLTLHRIPHGKSGPGASKRDPVLLMHGLFLGSDCFSTIGKKSLAFLLADRGYDVWLGNVRSVQNSRKHVKYNPDKDKEYWNFRFAKYDYGEEKNLVVYGRKESPEYNISKVTVPSALYYSKADFFVSPQKVEKLARQLPSVVDLHLIKDEDFTHVDFLWAKDVEDLLYNRIFDLMDKYRT